MWFYLLRLVCNCYKCITLLCGKVLPDPAPTSRFCAFFSATGILFMLWVGVMLSTQSFYIKGIEDPEKYRNSAFGAMGGFIVTFGVSILYLMYEAFFLSHIRGVGLARAASGSFAQSYERVSTSGSGGGSGGLTSASSSSVAGSGGGLASLPPGMTDYEVNMELASSTASNSPVDSDARSYSSTGSETRRRRTPKKEALGLGGELI